MELEVVEGRATEPSKARPTRVSRRVQRSASLVVGASDDAAEREADAVADRIVADLRTGPGGFGDDARGGRIRRAHGGTPVAEVGPAGGALGPELEATLRRSQGRGEQLHDPMRTSMEQSFGRSLGDVRIHRASRIAPRLGASAFTLGSDIHFAPGEYAPSTRRGQWLLGHELTHVVQQQGSAGSTAVDRSTRIRRNGDFVKELEDFTTSLKELSDLTMLRVRLVPWPGEVTEQIAKRFGIERFKQLVSAIGDSDVQKAGTELFLQADVADPYVLRGIAIAKRVKVAKAWKLGDAEHAKGLARAAAGEALSGDAMVAARKAAGITAVQLASAWLDQVGPRLADAKPWLLASPQTDRDAIFADKTVVAKAKSVLVLDDYLGLLPLLQVLEKPTTGIADPWGSFDTQTLGPMVDNVIRTHLSAYVGGAVTAGKQAEGQMSVVGDEDWELAFKRQWKKPGLQRFITGANAFVDVNQPERHIWIHKDRGGPGTAIHEGIHKYADPSLRDEIINRQRGGGADVCNLDEGLTELFTRTIIDRGKLGYARVSYVNQHYICTLLEARLGLDVLAKAYFDGAFDALKHAFAATTKNSWDTFETHLEANEYFDAENLI
jgi:hypothetical protein